MDNEVSDSWFIDEEIIGTETSLPA